MRSTGRLISCHTFLAVVFALAGWVSLRTTRAEAQTGDNAVYNYLGTTVVHSPAFIDAKVFTTKPPNNDLCSVLNYVLVKIVQLTYPQGAVIDARGLPAAGTSMTCPSSQPSPWSGITSPPPSTILLPATTSTTPISIPSMWSLPPNTHLIGEGDSIASSTTISTTIQAQSPSFSGSMIQFGSSLCLPPLGGPSTCAETMNMQSAHPMGNGFITSIELTHG